MEAQKGRADFKRPFIANTTAEQEEYRRRLTFFPRVPVLRELFSNRLRGERIVELVTGTSEACSHLPRVAAW